MTKEQKIRKEIKQIVDEIPIEDIEDRVKQDEQEEIIKRCEQLIKPEHANWIGISNQKAIKELLNMLKEKDKEIENIKYIKNSFDYVVQKETEKKDEIIEKLEKEAQIYFEENIKKDNMIHEMICSFIDLGFGFEYCNNDDRCINDCDKCIEQYFERKATNDG